LIHLVYNFNIYTYIHNIYVLLYFKIKWLNRQIKTLHVKQKRTYVQFSIAQKQQVALFVTQNKDITNQAVAEKFSKEFNLRIILLKH
jgi:hypothetical protein